MDRSVFVYVTYIRATPEAVWTALTDNAFIARYWFGLTATSAWTPGASWTLYFEDGRVADRGEILAAEPPHRLVIKWFNEFRPEFKAEGPGRCTFWLAPESGATKLTILHEMDRPESTVIAAVSDGWPKILSNLKSLMETGEVALKP